jgi:Ni,Fe-hydrogenase III small subunit
MPDQATHAARRAATLAAIPAALLVGALVFWLLGGVGRDREPVPQPARPAATGPVTLPAVPLTDRAASACRGLVARLPGALRAGTVQEAPRRPVTAGAEQNAAYGDPPITLRCGAGATRSVAPEDTVFGLSGVCWLADQRPEGTVWTTVDREVPVTVTVPAAYPEPGQWVIEFSAALQAAVPATAAPSGCR